METARTIDVRGLEHSEREALIFPALEALRDGDALRLVIEFNPVPLVHMLKAREEFEVAHEKEGPEAWILGVKRITSGGDKKDRLRALLRELQSGDVSEEIKERVRELLSEVDASTLGILEQELIREGVSHDEIRGGLCDIHLEFMRDALVESRKEVQAPHPVNTLMEEHKVILESLGELATLVGRLEDVKDLKAMGDDVARLQDIAHHLVEAESHHEREEEALFPALEKHDVVEPPNIMRMDHLELRKRKQELYRLAHNPEDLPFDEFKGRIIELGRYLSRELEAHIFKEDNILYQIALQLLTPEEWDTVKRDCDKIGYCCFTPEDQGPKEVTVELDLRPMPPFQRHERIFEEWDRLEPGQTLRIINDHDPRPLHYQFEAEQKGKYAWAYDQEGPRDWIVRITRTK
ncbi:MAG: DUF438 domain-containing protein [Candidatus Undinarchaeales archaeon]|jgi:hypothetical protein|nr:DUF438 domain-containing protein [Candidatus Undinarchaeales archaeon]MDP7491904.1 DUF438 domain-containing protein [Candidatus Undinarchaeales archaeon]